MVSILTKYFSLYSDIIFYITGSGFYITKNNEIIKHILKVFENCIIEQMLN